MAKQEEEEEERRTREWNWEGRGPTSLWAWGCPTYWKTMIDVCTPQSSHLLPTSFSSVSRCSRINSNRPSSFRARCKRSTPPHKAPFQHSNPKLFPLKVWSNPKLHLHLRHLCHLHNLNPHTPIIRVSLPTRNRPSKGSGGPYEKNGHRNANDSRLRARSGRIKWKASRRTWAQLLQSSSRDWWVSLCCSASSSRLSCWEVSGMGTSWKDFIAMEGVGSSHFPVRGAWTPIRIDRGRRRNGVVPAKRGGGRRLGEKKVGDGSNWSRAESESNTSSTHPPSSDGHIHNRYRTTQVKPSPTPNLFTRTRRIRILVSTRWTLGAYASSRHWNRAFIARPWHLVPLRLWAGLIPWLPIR